ncbi:uncharacterized protein UMAG_11980 [Mycosarcoma maydis]|uniref:Secreted protein n=1 Tax=Mycosarcoma maydis TaxID=5270 RepID=A0A0D1DSS0_MYCMD|nr:uncharacterized protein UMAG_11980 [Ustilago maydis 521]KIS67389.1 hypothetical protein UMAG_11980 [Ustilago maydis 521]|eukprot:XP_011391006.1 hypothetical protein UMAG_11980 [Ustilago maydis 521]
MIWSNPIKVAVLCATATTVQSGNCDANTVSYFAFGLAPIIDTHNRERECPCSVISTAVFGCRDVIKSCVTSTQRTLIRNLRAEFSFFDKLIIFEIKVEPKVS